MTNLQKIKAEAKSMGLSFVRQNATLNGARLYNFEDEFGNTVSRSWTISRAIAEMNYGDLRHMVC